MCLQGVALSEQNYSLSVGDPLSNLDGTIHGQAAWIPALGVVERKRNTRLEPTPPSIGSSNKRPQLPSWGRFF